MDTIGNRIRQRRRELKITQKQLADAIGVKSPSVTSWEGDSYKPNGDNLLSLSRALKCTTEWITKGGALASVAEAAPQYDNSTPCLPIITFEDAASATIPSDTEQYGIAPWDADMFGPKAFIVRMDDSSMESNSSESIQTGSLLFIDSPAPEVIQPGKMVVAMLDGDSKAVIRKYRDRGLDENGRPMFELAPLNDDYNKTTVNASNPGKIIGLLKMRQVMS